MKHMIEKRALLRFFWLAFIVLILRTSAASSTLMLHTDTEKDTSEQKRSGLTFIPILFYTPETKMGGGTGLSYFFRESGSDLTSRPSSIVPILIYTQKKQIVSELGTDLYWKNDHIHLSGDIGYTKFPDKFYGIGKNTPDESEEDYTPRDVSFSLGIQRKIHSEFHLGLHYGFEDRKMKEVEEGGQLVKKEIVGSGGGQTSGLGIVVNWDTRDNILFPTSGGFYQLSTNFYGHTIGSDYAFTSHRLDLRRYYPLFSSHVLAFQGYLYSVSGKPPFQKLGLLGGDSVLRGYYEGRYRDMKTIVVQMEHRLLLWRKFGLVGFVGAGDVAEKMSSFALNDLKHSIGFGLRYMLNPDEKMNVRLDYAIGKDSSGFYITALEAF